MVSEIKHSKALYKPMKNGGRSGYLELKKVLQLEKIREILLIANVNLFN